MEKRDRGELEEIKFTKYFMERGSIGNFHAWKREVGIHEPMSLMSRDFYALNSVVKKYPIGRIDIMFRRSGKLYCGEVKYYMPHRREFWDATKIIAYTEYYNWENEIMGGFDRAFPSVIIPLKAIKLEYKIIANKLRILLLGIRKEVVNGATEYFLEEVVNLRNYK